jgi:hypothetical protein
LIRRSARGIRDDVGLAGSNRILAWPSKWHTGWQTVASTGAAGGLTDFRLKPALRKVRRGRRGLNGGGFIKRVARQLHFPVGDDQRTGRQSRQRAERRHHRVGEARGRTDARLEIVDDLSLKNLRPAAATSAAWILLSGT